MIFLKKNRNARTNVVFVYLVTFSRVNSKISIQVYLFNLCQGHSDIFDKSVIQGRMSFSYIWCHFPKQTLEFRFTRQITYQNRHKLKSLIMTFHFYYLVFSILQIFKFCNVDTLFMDFLHVRKK